MDTLLESDVSEDEKLNMGSLNHSITAGRLVGLLFNDERFEVIPELSLDVSQFDLTRFNLKAKDELVPNVCVYAGALPALDNEVEDDILKVSHMPDLAIEVLSPKQSIGELIRKIKAYFFIGVKSCWLVVPSMEVVDVYSQPNQHRTFDMNDTEIVDEVIDIHLPIQRLFGRRFNQI